MLGSSEGIKIEIILLAAFEEIVAHVHKCIGLDWTVPILLTRACTQEERVRETEEQRGTEGERQGLPGPGSLPA